MRYRSPKILDGNHSGEPSEQKLSWSCKTYYSSRQFPTQIIYLATRLGTVVSSKKVRQASLYFTFIHKRNNLSEESEMQVKWFENS